MSSSKLSVYTFPGPPRERGRAQGEELRARIAGHLEKWKEVCVASTGLTVQHYLSRLYAETDFFPAIETYTPDLLEEVRGIAEGAGQEFELVMARQLSDEEPWFRTWLRYEEVLGENCSALAAGKEEGLPPLVAQNMDTPGYYNGDQVVLRVREPGTEVEALVFTVAGKLSLCGMNNRGVAICCNTLSQLDYSRTGLPEDFIVRRVLQLENLAQVKDFMFGVPHASGQNYVLGDSSGVTDLECSAGKVVEMKPDPDTGRLAHTNHPLVNDDTGFYTRGLEKLKGRLSADDEKRLSRSTTERRLKVLKELMAGTEVLTPEEIGRILSDRTAPLCARAETYYTAGTVIFELDKEHPRFHVAVDPSAGTPFETLTFDGDDKNG